MNYYKDQLNKIITNGAFPPSIVVHGQNKDGNTKHLSLNPESAQCLVDWLTTNFLSPAQTKIDLFEDHENLPKAVQTIIESYGDDFGYDNCRKMQKQLNKLGYSFEYGLDGQPINLHRVVF